MHGFFFRAAEALHPTAPRAGALLALALLWALTGCSEGSPTQSDPPVEPSELAVVVNSVEVTLTLFDPDEPEASRRTVELGVPDATPVGASIRGELALVPMGVVPTAAVVDLSSGVVTRNIALPSGSGATGSIFVNDSMALVANPMRGTVTPVNVHTGSAGEEIPVGNYPSGFVRSGDRIAVVNTELVNFEPVRTGTLTVLDAQGLGILGTVELSGENSGPAQRAPDGRILVLNSGRFGQGTGSLSAVDLELMSEVEHHDGFGEFPGGLAVAGDGRVFISSWSYGIAVWNSSTAGFERAPSDAVAPGDVPSAAGVAVDAEGRLHSLSPDCSEPGRVHRLGPDFQVELSVPVGVCPVHLGFTSIEAG
jgi:hypothetical protein